MGIFSNLNELSNYNFKKYDYVIVGSGPAGLVLSLELSKIKTKQILLLEGGNYSRNDFNQNNLYSGDDIGRYVRNNKYDHLIYDRLRMIGGSSNIWGGQTRKLDNIDFINRNWVNCSDWPIEYNDLSEFYERSKYYLDIGDYINNNSLPHDEEFNKFDKIIFQHTNSPLLAKRFKKKIIDADNLDFIFNANLLKLNYDNELVTSINIISDNKNCKEVKSKKFIFAMGGIENARQLLLQLPENLSKSLPIGNYFQGHYSGLIGNFRMNRKKIKYFTDNYYQLINNHSDNSNKKTVHSYMLKINDLDQTKYKTLNFSFMFYYSQAMIALRRLPLALKNYAYFKNRFRSDSKYVINEITKIAKYFSNNILNHQIYFVMEQEPNYNSYVKLSDSKDYFGLRKTKINWKTSTLDFESFKKSINLIQDKFNINDECMSNNNIVDFWNSAPLDTQSHHIGTTRMGNNIDNSVIDKNLKVHNIKNLFIAGSSVFPTGGISNPTLTITAFSIRLADHLKSL